MGQFVETWGQERVDFFQDERYYNIFYVDGDDSLERGTLMMQ